MTNEEYDKFICEKFPELFRDRRKPMNQTCMCWGFSIGEGWHQLLYDLCEKLDYIREQTGLLTVFDQIKEKFGGGRFYYHIDGSSCKLEKKMVELWASLINSLVGRAENESDETCAVCGKKYYGGHITVGGWVYDSCKECLLKSDVKNRYENFEEIINKAEKQNERYEALKWQIDCLNDAQLTKVEELVKEITPKKET